MGNRAVITTRKRDLGLYLHWNGGSDSVEAFLRYCELRGFRCPEKDDYGWARLCQVVANFMGGNGLSVGILPYTTDEKMVSYGDDNGVYVIEGWKIVDRIYPYEGFEEQEGYGLDAMLRVIDELQPEDMRLGKLLDAAEVPVSEVKRGNIIWLRTHRGWETARVLGFGDGVVNGRDVTGVPYGDLYRAFDPKNNINNYPSGDTVRVTMRLPKDCKEERNG